MKPLRLLSSLPSRLKGRRPQAVLVLVLEHGFSAVFRKPLQCFRTWRLRQLFAELGSNPYFDPTFRITGAQRVSIGDNFYAGWSVHLKSLADVRQVGQPNLIIGNNVRVRDGTIIDANYSIQIGHNTTIGPYSLIIDNNHRFNDPALPIRDQGNVYQPVVIGRDCWLGAQVIVLPGVTIGEHVVVAANSTVTKDVPPYTVVAGSPSRPIRSLRKHVVEA